MEVVVVIVVVVVVVIFIEGFGSNRRWCSVLVVEVEIIIGSV